jgi:pimeloyl-ACP methyl ester carboxylesterase
VSHSTWCRFMVGLTAAALGLWPWGAAAQPFEVGRRSFSSPDVSVIRESAMGAQRHSGKATGSTRGLDRAQLDGVELEYEVRGEGEPVVLVHAGIFADWNRPLLEEPTLAGRYRLVSYHRVGSAGSSRLAGPVSVAEEAGQLRALMRHLGIERAHLVGHSNGATLILQLALDAPEAVHTMVLLESARPSVPGAPQEQEFATAFFEPAGRRYAAGDKAGALDIFLRGVAGPEYRAELERVLPGAFDQYVVDADTFFGQQLPALRSWSFTPEDASRVRQPALAVLGANSTAVTPTFGPRQELLLRWLPNAEGFVLPDATHLLHLQNPRGLAEGLADFFARHPLAPTD